MVYDISLITLYDWVKTGGLPAILALILFGGYKGWWFFGREVVELRKRIVYLEHSNTRWMELAFKSTKIAEEVTVLIRDSDEEVA